MTQSESDFIQAWEDNPWLDDETLPGNDPEEWYEKEVEIQNKTAAQKKPEHSKR